MDRQKQVEEMTRELSNIQTYAYMEIYPCRQKQPNEIVAEHLVRKGWIKPDESAVVMTREEKVSLLHEMYEQGRFDAMADLNINGKIVLTEEEYENLQEKIRILEVQLDLERTRTLEEWLKITRKETAEKIANNIEDILQEPYKGKTEKQEYQRKGMEEGLRMALEICKEIIEE